jgi:hypothetical protein
MKLEELKGLVQNIEPDLADYPFVIVHVFTRNGRALHLGLTNRLRQKCRKKRIWNSKAFLTALKNAEYGFDEQLARSAGGQDGIFLVDRNYRPRNAMQNKLFDNYLDRSDSGVQELAANLNTSVETLQAVRLVSHHMRLLGILWRGRNADWLILVDYDQS